MRIPAAKKHSERPENSADNIYHFHSLGRSARHLAIRKYLCDLVDRHDRESVIAVACVFIQADGTIDVSAKGVDFDLADNVLDGLGHLSARIRHHTKTHRASHHRQRGSITIGLLAAITLSVCAYLNMTPWLDSAIVLATHLLPNPRMRPGRFLAKRQ
ncbi:Uncharacterised protein [Burkholderia pseudomallei]|nr:Uncharacterised protein [Burkholderia pseudomallei]